MSVHVKEQLMGEISRALHNGMLHNHIVLLAHKTPDIIIKHTVQSLFSVWLQGRLNGQLKPGFNIIILTTLAIILICKVGGS